MRLFDFKSSSIEIPDFSINEPDIKFAVVCSGF